MNLHHEISTKYAINTEIIPYRQENTAFSYEMNYFI
jgi:hypothetical protein